MKPRPELRTKFRRLLGPAHFPSQVALAYVIVGSLWFLFADNILLLIAGAPLPERWETVTGLGFVAITALFLFAFIRRDLSAAVRHAVDAVQEKEQLLRELTEQIEEVFWLADAAGGQIRYVSPAYEKIWQRPRADVIGASSIWQHSIHPDDRPGVKDVPGLAEAESHDRRYRIVREDGSVRWIQERMFPIYDDQGTIRRIAGIAQDITARVSDPELLEVLVHERMHGFRTLLDGSQRITSIAPTLAADALPGLILEQLTNVVEYSSAALFTVEDEWLRPIAGRGANQMPEPLQVSQLSNQPALSALAKEEEPLVIPALEADTAPVRALRDAFGPHVRASGSWIGVPLVTPSTVGLLVADHFQSGYFTAQKTELIVAFANQAAGAIESAWLYEQTQQRVAESEGLRRVTLALVQKHTLDELLAIICDEACDLIGAAGSFIFLKENEEQLRLAYRGDLLQVLADRIPMATTHTGRAIRRGEPAVVNEQDQYRAETSHADPSIECLLVIPLRVEDNIIGALDMINKPGGFSHDDVRTLSLFADAAALALERARLQRESEQLAVLRERQRLARELHDSVTQALYSLSLHTTAARMALTTGDRAAALENMEEIRNVAREATLDMRRLIFELRPPALETEGLVNALKMRLASVEARAGLKTAMEVSEELDLPFAIEEELYWIASEALNNIIKYARANRVIVRLAATEDEVRLVVQDDGVGFEPELARSGGVGLRNMAERAEKIQGQFRIESPAAGGTRVSVSARLPREASEQ